MQILELYKCALDTNPDEIKQTQKEIHTHVKFSCDTSIDCDFFSIWEIVKNQGIDET